MKSANRREGHNLLTRRTIDFGALVKAMARGIGRDESFYPLGVEGLWELYRWMTSSVTGAKWGGPAAPWRWPTRWGDGSLCADLGGRPSCTSVTGITPIYGSAYADDRHQDANPPWGWRSEIARRLHHALFDTDEFGKMGTWRREMGIDPAGKLRVPMLTYDHVPPPPRSTLRSSDGTLYWRSSYGDPKEGNGLGGEVDRLFALATPTRRLIPQLNPHHVDARFLTAVKLKPSHAGWIVMTEYGFDGSRWDGPSMSQKKGEPFANFVYRVHDKIEALLTPPCGPRRRCADQRKASPFEPKPKWVGEQSYRGASCDVRAS